jgi:transposase
LAEHTPPFLDTGRSLPAAPEASTCSARSAARTNDVDTDKRWKTINRQGRQPRTFTPEPIHLHRPLDKLGSAASAHYRATLTAREAAVAAIDADLTGWFSRAPFADPVARLAAYRGITQLGALTLASEVGDWRRFATAGAFMGFCGLVPSEYSSGERIRRGHITHAGNLHLRTQLVESAWAYKSRAGIGSQIARRHHNLPPEVIARAWKAQLRLCGRFRRLDARKTSRNLVVTAIARELAGFVWAEMTS